MRDDAERRIHVVKHKYKIEKYEKRGINVYGRDVIVILDRCLGTEGAWY